MLWLQSGYSICVKRERNGSQGNRVNEQVTNRESSESMAPLDSGGGYQPWPTQQRLARRSTKLSFF